MAAVAPNFTMYDDNSQALQFAGLFALSADQFGLLSQKNYQDSGVVTATLYDVKGNPVTGLNGISLNYVAGSNGVYTGIVGPDFAPTPGVGLYTLVITAVAGGATLTYKIPTTIVQRTPQVGL